MINSAWEHFRI